MSLVGDPAADIVAAGAPLQAILSHVLASYQHSPADSKDAIRAACNLLSVSRGFRRAIAGCKGLVTLDFSPRTTEAAAQVAAWLAKHGHLLNKLQLGLHKGSRFMQLYDRPVNSVAFCAAAETAIAGGLQAAAAVAGGLHISACKLAAAGPDCPAILQALSASKLSSLDLSISLPEKTSPDDKDALLEEIGHAFASLRQLKQLKMSGCGQCLDYIGVGSALQELSALTTLTSLNVPEVADGSELLELPASLLELQLTLAPEYASDNELRLGHLTALTKLELGECDVLQAYNICHQA